MDVDAVITAQRTYHDELTHLKVHRIENGEAQPPEALRKVDVLRPLLKQNQVFYTGRLEEGSITLQREVRVVTRSSNAYLRVDDQDEAKDFLADLPNF